MVKTSQLELNGCSLLRLSLRKYKCDCLFGEHCGEIETKLISSASKRRRKYDPEPFANVELEVKLRNFLKRTLSRLFYRYKNEISVIIFILSFKNG